MGFETYQNKFRQCKFKHQLWNKWEVQTKSEKMILNIVTTAYFLSMILMAFWTNIRPFYIHDSWNDTQMSPLTNLSHNTDSELGSLDIIVIINLVVVSLVGKNKKSPTRLEVIWDKLWTYIWNWKRVWWGLVKVKLTKVSNIHLSLSKMLWKVSKFTNQIHGKGYRYQ